MKLIRQARRILIRKSAYLLLPASWYLKRSLLPIGSGRHRPRIRRYLCFLVRHDRKSPSNYFSGARLTDKWFGRRKIFITGLAILTAL